MDDVLAAGVLGKASGTCVASYREARAGVNSIWRTRLKDYFIDIADDGYAIATGPEIEEQELLAVQHACSSGDWYFCSATNCLGECGASGCNCSRSRNPTCREAFQRTAVQRVMEITAGKNEVSYASLGCGLLRFDFGFLESLLAAGVPVTAVHLVDSMYDPDAEGYQPHRIAVAQFAAWFANRSVDVYVHTSIHKFTFRARQANLLPIAVMQVDCSELTWVFESEVKPMLEEVLHYGGLFCALTAREGASVMTGGQAALGASDAWGELWRLVPESGRLKLVSNLRYRPGERDPQQIGDDEALPPAQGHSE